MSTLLNNQGKTSSCSWELSLLVMRSISAKALYATYLRPSRWRFATTRATCFWWAALRSDLRAFCCTPLLEISAATRASAASKRCASINSAFLISWYSFDYYLIMASSFSSNTSMRACSKTFSQSTFNIGSTSLSKSKSS
jgi:hypothetical protein